MFSFSSETSKTAVATKGAGMQHYDPCNENGSLIFDRLANVGSRLVITFAFSFLQRMWRAGEDTDLCTEMLKVRNNILSLLDNNVTILNTRQHINTFFMTYIFNSETKIN